MKQNLTLLTLLCVSTLALLPGCLGKKETKKETPKTEKVITRTEKVTRSHSKELIEE